VGAEERARAACEDSDGSCDQVAAGTAAAVASSSLCSIHHRCDRIGTVITVVTVVTATTVSTVVTVITVSTVVTATTVINAIS
jgi:hypothetical protein